MKRLAIIRGGVATALMLGILVAVASSADASPSGQLGAYMRQGLSLKRAQAALATQSQVETAELPTKLEEALGASFAGVWFEPNTAKFSIGVVSGASRRAAEQVVAQAGLAGVVSYVSVRSTWSQLISAQREWNGKLIHLRGRQQFSTGLTAANNAVSVRLSSSLPEHERALLEREAARSHVNVSITVVPPEALAVRADNSQCEVKPKANYAFCSKPIAAGVLIAPNAAGTGYCTAGPLAILANPATLAAELETLLITAGHCLEGNPKWSTSPHPAAELTEIGPRLQFENGLAGDYGDIEVTVNWLQAGLTPALAQITNYQDNGLREARNVIGEEASVLNASFCHQGATSGEQCGAITAVNQLDEIRNPSTGVILHIDGLVFTNACSEGGDSGGPYHTLAAGNSVRILGTHVGGIGPACSGLFCPNKECETAYEPIKTSLTALKLTLLTISNQTRHKLPHEWLIGGKLIASPVKVHSHGLLLLTDDTAPGGATAVHCFGFNSGTVGPHALDLIETITAEKLGTNKKITCKFDKTGACEAATAPTAEAIHLPWHTELTLFGSAVRDMVMSDGAGNPGWAVTCKTILGNVTDTCENALTSTALEIVAGGVLALFDATSNAANCKVGGEAVRNGAGLVRGDVTILSPGGGAEEKLTEE
jgi:hypothetical protein